MKKHINSDILATNWSQDASFCSWIGVICRRRHPRVFSLDLSNMDIRGTVASEIGNLSFLTTLNMSNNKLSGLIPAEIGKLRDMAHNQLKDHIPQSLGLLRRMESLKLRNNYLSGDIPTALSTCAHLTTLDLSYNNLSGNFSQLQLLFLRSNHELTEALVLGGNNLSGNIPSSIDRSFPNIQYFDLAFNQFHGN
ncbi:hypothetical protein C2S52_013298 [Perilla frutescens var. hirtella]|nr:hypothetical protein C2S52_013298 [Perilla frutescens var. hirtella]